MVVGLAVWELLLPGCSSLKEKRQVVRSLKDRLRHELHLSAAETGHQDVLQRAQLAAAVVSGDRVEAARLLQRADRMVEDEGRARIVDSSTTFY